MDRENDKNRATLPLLILITSLACAEGKKQEVGSSRSVQYTSGGVPNATGSTATVGTSESLKSVSFIIEGQD